MTRKKRRARASRRATSPIVLHSNSPLAVHPPVRDRTPAAAPGADRRAAARRSRSAKAVALTIGVLNLAGLALAEAITIHLDPGLGAACYALLAAAAIVLAVHSAGHSAAEQERLGFSPRSPETGFFVVLALPPLTRLVMLATPTREFSEIERYGVLSLALVGAAWAAARANAFDRRAVGLVVKLSPLGVPLDLVVAFSGVAIGYFEYSTRRPNVEIDVLEPDRVLFASLAILVGVGFAEALLTRGVLQVAATRLFGSIVGITYSAAVIAVLQVGYRSWRELLLVFAGSIVLGAAFRLSGSLLGVGLAYAVANLCLFAIFPHVSDLPSIPILSQGAQTALERPTGTAASWGATAAGDLEIVGLALASTPVISIHADDRADMPASALGHSSDGMDQYRSERFGLPGAPRLRRSPSAMSPSSAATRPCEERAHASESRLVVVSPADARLDRRRVGERRSHAGRDA